MLREMAELLETLTADRPLLLVLEDLQWVDHATVDGLAALARRRAPARLLLVATYRPVDLAFWHHPLQALTQDLRVHQLCHKLAVEPLSEADSVPRRRAHDSPCAEGGSVLPLSGVARSGWPLQPPPGGTQSLGGAGSAAFARYSTRGPAGAW
jgi:hypothetical protein